MKKPNYLLGYLPKDLGGVGIEVWAAAEIGGGILHGFIDADRVNYTEIRVIAADFRSFDTKTILNT